MRSGRLKHVFIQRSKLYHTALNPKCLKFCKLYCLTLSDSAFLAFTEKSQEYALLFWCG